MCLYKFQVYSWRTYSDHYGDDTNRSLSVEKHGVNKTRFEKPWYYRRERRPSLEAVAAGVNLFSTSINKPLSVVREDNLIGYKQRSALYANH